MFQEKFPIFERDMILKADMLTCLKEYPKNMFELQYADYSSGIITGVKVVIEGNYLVISPGIIKWNNKLLLMEKEYKVPYEATGVLKYLKVQFLEENKQSDFIIYNSEIVLEEAEVSVADELELCRFLLKTGAVLRQDYQNLSDFTTLHNTVNIVHAPYAGHLQATLSPEIMHYFSNEMFKYPLENPYDISFSMLCLQEKRVEREVIENYVMKRLNVRGERRENFASEDMVDRNNSMKAAKKQGMFSNEQLHRYLRQILENVQLGRNGGGLRDGGGRRMIVE